jgi:hypothetical protein
MYNFVVFLVVLTVDSGTCEPNFTWKIHVPYSSKSADNLTTFMCRLSQNLGASTLMEPSGPVQVCNGIASNFTFSLTAHRRNSLLQKFILILPDYMGRHGRAGIATRYDPKRPGLESRYGPDIFLTCLDRPWDSHSILCNGYWVFLGGKTAGAWCWPPTPIDFRG